MIKKSAIYLMLGIATMLASCSQDDALQNTVTQNDALTPVTITAALPGEGMQTRAVSGTEDEAPTKAYLEILVKQPSNTYSPATGDLAGVKTMTKSDGNFTLSGIYLDPTVEYRFLFWADNATITTTPADLQNVAYEKNSIAFAAKEDWSYSGSNNAISATLKHVVSKVTLKTTTTVDNGAKVSITLPATYTTYNVSSGAVVEASQSNAAFEVTTAEITGSASGVEVFSFYALVDGDNQDLTLTHNDYEKSVTSVPLAPNKHTTLVGDVRNIGLTEVSFTASFEDTWGDTAEEIIGLEIADDGTYIVSSKEALLAWAEAAQSDLSLNCTLAADITLTGTNNWMPVGNVNSQYNGTFDGAGHTISGLNIDSSTGLRNVGLIGFLEPSGTVKNLIIMNASIQTLNTGYNVVGGIVGNNWGTIQGCGFSGTISANGGDEVTATCIAGGIAGSTLGQDLISPHITACWSTATVKTLGNGVKHAGGISGYVANASVLTACYYTNADKGVGSSPDNTTLVDNDVTTWDAAATTMNNALTDEEYRWVVTGDANVPLKLEKKSN